MNTIRNLLAVVGLITLIGSVYLYAKNDQLIRQISEIRKHIAVLGELDPKAGAVYQSMWQKLGETGVSAEASVIRYSLADDVSPEDAEETMRYVANEHNIKAVGELPLSSQVALETGNEQRFLKIYQYCNPQTAMKMVMYSAAFAAYLPCSIALVEDQQGKYHLYALNMDMMLYGGKSLPEELHTEAVKVQEIILDIMQRASTGDF